MGLITGLNILLTGSQTAQGKLDLAATNVANTYTDGYVRREVNSVIQSDGSVALGSIERIVNELLLSQRRDQSSVVGYSSTLNSYYSTVEDLLGSPSGEGNLYASINNFFLSLNTLTNDPSMSSLQLDSVRKGEQLANAISNFAGEIENIRYQVDNDYTTTIDQINSDLSALFQINLDIEQNNVSGVNISNLLDQRDTILNRLSNNIEINVTERGDGRLYVTTAKGISLVDDFLHQIDYSGVPDVDSLVENTPIVATRVLTYDSRGKQIKPTTELINSGVEGEIENPMVTGKLKALTELRDVLLPNVLEEIDTLAKNVIDQVNAIHNLGTGFPAPTSLTGTRLVSLTDQHYFSGNVMIGLVDVNGLPLPSRYSDETGLRPLTLNLGALNSGLGAGQPTIQDIIDEINYYYGPPQPRVSLGNLQNISLAMVSDQVTAGGSVSFDLDLTNNAPEGSTVTIQNVVVTDGAANGQTVTVPAAFPAASFTVPAGGQMRSGASTGGLITFTDDGVVDSPYTIDVTVQVDDGNGNISTDTITYVIGSSPSGTGPGMRNERFTATSVGGTATIIQPSSSARFATAELVDEDGNITSSGSGYLRIRTADSSYHIAITDLGSSELGSVTNSSEEATMRGFSHFFELNNFFNEAESSTNSAINMSVSEQLLSDPSRISLGTLTNIPAYVDGDDLYTYEVSVDSNTIIDQLAKLKDQSITFGAAGTLSARSVGIESYAVDIVSILSFEIYQSRNSNDIAQQTLSDIEADFQSYSGVNMDEEMASFVTLQYFYNANARGMSIIKELMDTFFELLG